MPRNGRRSPSRSSNDGGSGSEEESDDSANMSNGGGARDMSDSDTAGDEGGESSVLASYYNKLDRIDEKEVTLSLDKKTI